jgi:hypothetical protein
LLSIFSKSEAEDSVRVCAAKSSAISCSVSFGVANSVSSVFCL